MRRMFFVLLCLFVPTAILADDVIDRAMQTVVAIFPADPDDQAYGGSGVVISPDGYVVTNFHVVQPYGPAMKCGMADGKLYDAIIVGLDPVGDIAIIKLLGRTDFPFAPFTDSSTVAIGDIAIVMGNPFLLATDFKPCVSQGIISGTNRYQFPVGTFLEYSDCLQTDAAVNPGNSGGPLFNDRGEIIGIIGRCSFEKRGRVNVGIGYAVSGNQVQYFLGDLKSGRIVDHATLNAVVSTDQQGRVMFDDVLSTSDAYRNGLRYNDELLRFAGRVIDSANAFKNLVGIFPKNWRLPLTVRGKEGTRYDLFVRLGGLHGENELIEMTEKMVTPPIVPEQKEEDGKKMIVPKQKEIYISDVIKPFYEERRGYANFYFNRLEQARVIARWRSASPFSHSSTTQSSTPWVLTGKLKDRPDTFSFQIEDNGVRYNLPVASGFWNADLMLEIKDFIVDPTTHYQSPHGSGGLFTALYLLRQLTLSKTMDDVEFAYTGTAPIGGNLTKLYDVCTVTWRGNDVRFYVDPDNVNSVGGAIPLIEMFGSGFDFPCEIYFYGNTMEVRYGRLIFGVFETATAFREPTTMSSVTVCRQQTANGNRIEPVIDESLRKVVKIYEAEVADIHGYQSGILVSPDGYILTALTSALQTDPIMVVLDSGQKFKARFVAADPILEIALLKIPGLDLLHFDISRQATKYPLGMPVYAISNPFNIAQGNERATVQRGTIAAQTMLSARRGVFETPYKGEILVVDMTTNNPGTCGGALISATSGELLGILGKELINNENHSWLNFAIPTFVWSEQVRSMMKDGGTVSLFTEKTIREREMIPEDTIQIFQNWGILFITSVSRRTPPFIDLIRPGSEAEKRGLLPDDLIVMVNSQLTPSIAAVEYHIHQIPVGHSVTLTIEREATLLEVTFKR